MQRGTHTTKRSVGGGKDKSRLLLSVNVTKHDVESVDYLESSVRGLIRHLNGGVEKIK